MADELLRVLSRDIDDVEVEGPQLAKDELLRLYEAIVSTRALDERSSRLHADGEIGFYVAGRGVEAVSVGSGFVTESADWVFPSHRDAGMYLLRGGSLRSWLDQLFGNAADLTKGRQAPGHHSLPDGRFVSVSGPLGTQLAQAAGCAMAIALRGDRSVALACFGAAAASTPGFHAAVQLAAEFQPPAVFVCRTGAGGAGGEGGGDRLLPATPVAELARARGIESTRVDGADVLAVVQAVAAARQRALDGAGATLVEAVLGSVGAADGTGAGSDPVGLLRDYLEHRGIWDAAREEDLNARVRQRLDEAVEAARATGPPPPDSLFTDVYAAPPWMLQEQRELAAAGAGADDDPET